MLWDKMSFFAFCWVRLTIYLEYFIYFAKGFLLFFMCFIVFFMFLLEDDPSHLGQSNILSFQQKTMILLWQEMRQVEIGVQLFKKNEDNPIITQDIFNSHRSSIHSLPHQGINFLGSWRGNEMKFSPSFAFNSITKSLAQTSLNLVS